MRDGRSESETALPRARPVACLAPMRWLFLFLLAGCAASTTGTSSEEVVRGVAADARGDAVVRLEIDHAEHGTKELCSGTLLAPDVVLTARHCLAVRDLAQPRPACRAGSWVDTPDSAYVGNVAPGAIHVIIGRSIATDPSGGVVGGAAAPSFDGAPVAAVGTRIVDDGAGEMCGHDVAVIVLDHAVDAPTTSIREAPPVVGEKLTAVGWGRTENGYPLAKQMRTGIPVLAVGAGLFTYTRASGAVLSAALVDGELAVGESVCNGDSGGPLLDDAGMVVGVVSRTVQNGSVRCVDTPVVYSQASAWRGLTGRTAGR